VNRRSGAGANNKSDIVKGDDDAKTKAIDEQMKLLIDDIKSFDGDDPAGYVAGKIYERQLSLIDQFKADPENLAEDQGKCLLISEKPLNDVSLGAKFASTEGKLTVVQKTELSGPEECAQHFKTLLGEKFEREFAFLHVTYFSYNFPE
jgi:hypothetical protein